MENPGILNPRGWSVVRKAQVAGIILGAAATIGGAVLPVVFSETHVGYAILLLWSLIARPAWLIAAAFGWEPYLYTEQGFSIAAFSLAFFINLFLTFLLGTVVGWLMNAYRCTRK